MEEVRLELYFQEKQKALIKGKIVSVKKIYSDVALGWINVEGVIYAVYPLSGRDSTKSGLLMPALKNTEEQMKNDYKRLFGIDIPEDVHQWPYKKEEE